MRNKKISKIFFIVFFISLFCSAKNYECEISYPLEIYKVEKEVNFEFPIKIKVFLLKEKKLFEIADYFELQSEENLFLKQTLVKCQEYFFLPDEKRKKIDIYLKKEIEYIGFFAEYKDIKKKTGKYY